MRPRSYATGATRQFALTCAAAPCRRASAARDDRRARRAHVVVRAPGRRRAAGGAGRRRPERRAGRREGGDGQRGREQPPVAAVRVAAGAGGGGSCAHGGRVRPARGTSLGRRRAPSLRAVDLGRGAVEAVGLAGGGERRRDLLHLRDPPPALARGGVARRPRAARRVGLRARPLGERARPRRRSPAPSRGSRGASRPSPSSRRRRPSSAPRPRPGSRAEHRRLDARCPSNAAATRLGLRAGEEQPRRALALGRRADDPAVDEAPAARPRPRRGSSATVAGETAFASTNSPPRARHGAGDVERGVRRADRQDDVGTPPRAAAGEPASRRPAAPRARAVAALRPSPAHTTSWPRSRSRAPSAAPISPGCSTPIDRHGPFMPTRCTCDCRHARCSAGPGSTIRAAMEVASEADRGRSAVRARADPRHRLRAVQPARHPRGRASTGSSRSAASRR